MKKRVISLLLAGGLAASMLCGTVAAESETNEILTAEDSDVPVVGGWNLENTKTIPEDAREALEKALDGIEGAVYVPVQLLASQVVAGMNYAFLCQTAIVYPDALPEYCIVYVYEDLEGNASLEDVQDLISVSRDTEGVWSVTVSEKEDSVEKAVRENISYAVYDFDFDGREELVLEYASADTREDAYILGVYTQAGDETISLFTSDEYRRFYITDLTGEGDYAFYSLGDTDLEQYEYIAYTFYEEQLRISQAVRYDSQSEDPWMMGYEEDGELVYRDSIEEEMGNAVIEVAENYRVTLDTMPLAES